MGWDPDAQQLQALSSEKAANWKKGPVFHEGEEIELKGIPFIIVDIAPGQIKLKPKRTAEREQSERVQALRAELEQLQSKS